MTSSLRTHDWLVLEGPAGVVGYAYGSPYRSRAAYRWACEVSVYMELGRRRTGGGRALYEALLARLAERGFTGTSRMSRHIDCAASRWMRPSRASRGFS